MSIKFSITYDPHAHEFVYGYRFQSSRVFEKRTNLLALLLQALIERELRQAMQREGITELPLYPKKRKTQRPTAEQILRLFSLVQRHSLQQEGQTIHTFNPELTDLQRQELGLLGVPTSTTTLSSPSPWQCHDLK